MTSRETLDRRVRQLEIRMAWVEMKLRARLKEEADLLKAGSPIDGSG